MSLSFDPKPVIVKDIYGFELALVATTFWNAHASLRASSYILLYSNFVMLASRGCVALAALTGAQTVLAKSMLQGNSSRKSRGIFYFGAKLTATSRPACVQNSGLRFHQTARMVQGPT